MQKTKDTKRLKNTKYIKLYLFLCFMSLFSCTRPDRLEEALQMAGDNRAELEKALSHYSSNPADSLKLKAAKFLIENMIEHYSLSLDAGDSINDIEKISSDYLISRIDYTLEVVRSQPWSDQIDESLFCNYILPYRVTNELLSDYHKTLYQSYQPLIEGITDVVEAFSIVYRTILDNFSLTTPQYSHIPDVLTLHKLQSGTCSHRCVYLICVLRSLGIPSAYDYVATWANYSQGGHTWVSLIGINGATYSIFEKDTLAKQYNRIDGSLLSGSDFVAENTDKISQRVDSIKKISKIYRLTYSVSCENVEIRKSKNHPSFFHNLHTQDVSEAYGLDGAIEIELATSTDYAYLYTFASVRNWQPAACAKVKHKKALFEHIGTNVAYLPIICKDDRQNIPAGYPILLQSDRCRVLKPDTSQVRTVVLKRKYPLYSQWVRRGNSMVGGSFEGSQTPDFRISTLLYRITDIPLAATTVNIYVPESVRYVRYLPPGNTRTSIAETTYYTNDEQGKEDILRGFPIGCRIEKESILKAFDGSYSTYTETPLEYFWFGLDLGSQRRITRIDYCPINDGNLIEKGTSYELFYWDKQWLSLGKTTANCDSLVYSQAPDNALFWLKCHAGGREERIFTYENGQQVWW